MKGFIQDFTTRQYMIRPDFEYFHYADRPQVEVEYHNHDFYEVFFLLAGKVVYYIEGKAYNLKPGDIILVNHKELHKPVIEEGSPYERIVVWLNPEYVKSLNKGDANLCMCFEETLRKKYNLLRPNADHSRNLRQSVSNLEKVYNRQGYGDAILKSVFITELVVYLNKAFLDTDNDEIELDIEYDEKISSILEYINGNLNGDLSLDTISSRFFLSKFYLVREFRKHAGYTIHGYILQKRLIMAKELLRENRPVTEVCNECGFGNYSNFIRAFKKNFGISPGRFNRRD